MHDKPPASCTVGHFIRVVTLPRVAMRKRGLCCPPMSLSPSVCLSRSCIVSKRLQVSSKKFLGLVVPKF